MIYRMSLDGFPGSTTQKVQVSNEVKKLRDLCTYKNGDGKMPAQVLITCEDADVRFAFLTDPHDSAHIANPSVGHLLVKGQSLKLNNSQQAVDCRFIAATSGETSTLQVSFMYEVPEGA